MRAQHLQHFTQLALYLAVLVFEPLQVRIVLVVFYLESIFSELKPKAIHHCEKMTCFRSLILVSPVCFNLLSFVAAYSLRRRCLVVGGAVILIADISQLPAQVSNFSLSSIPVEFQITCKLSQNAIT